MKFYFVSMGAHFKRRLMKSSAPAINQSAGSANGSVADASDSSDDDFDATQLVKHRPMPRLNVELPPGLNPPLHRGHLKYLEHCDFSKAEAIRS
jgi:hypothetical protein